MSKVLKITHEQLEDALSKSFNEGFQAGKIYGMEYSLSHVTEAMDNLLFEVRDKPIIDEQNNLLFEVASLRKKHNSYDGKEETYER